MQARRTEAIRFSMTGVNLSSIGFYRPDDQREVTIQRGDHANIILKQPERFGIARERLPVRPTLTDYERVLDMVLGEGWVRVSFVRHCWIFQGINLRLIRQTMLHYYGYGITEAYIDVGQTVNQPEQSFSLSSYEAVRRFVRTGRLSYA